ncbi:MAG TPA: TonB-dependent receptor [Bacteroidetes bacterium]|nr:TonB-dependent receptor [Bacteroidota bacterium]
MMKIFSWVLCIFLIAGTHVFPQKKTDAHVYGHVLNKRTGQHIPYIHITLKGTTYGTATDATGHYFLKNLPTGTYILTASGIGYKTAEHEVELTAGQSLEVNFEIEEDEIMLDNVVISANRKETLQKEAPAIVHIIYPRLFESSGAVCLAQGLNFQPGVRMETRCQNCGFQQVRINGMDGNYSQILINSRPVVSSLASVYAIEQIPVTMIERVEIIRGGGSALFGSNAIAGTINIITREPEGNAISLANTTQLIGGTRADLNTSLNASVVSDDDRAGITVFGSTRTRNPYDHNGDGFTETGKLNTSTLGFSSYYRTGTYSKISLEYHNLYEFRRGGNRLDLPPHKTAITEQTDHLIDAGSIQFTTSSNNGKHRINLYTSAQHIHRKSYYGAGQDPNAYGKTHDLTWVTGMQYTLTSGTLRITPSELTLGAEYLLNRLNDEMPGYDRKIKQAVDAGSLFVQNEWKNKNTSILLGIRLDKHTMVDHPVLSPRLNIRYNPTDNLNLRIGYSSGFRAPQTYDEDLHITAVGGHVAIITRDPDLKTEKSHSYSASLNLYSNTGTAPAYFLLEGFYTSLDHIFILEEAGADTEGNLILVRKNGSGAVIQGILLEGKIVPVPEVQFQFGMTFQKSLYNEPQVWSNNQNLEPRRQMFRSPGRYGYFTASWEPAGNVSLNFTGNYTGPMLVQHYAGYIPEDTVEETPSFFDATVKVARNVRLNSSCVLQLNGGIKNILNSYQDDFDQGEYRDAGYIYGPSLPRTFFLGMKFNL